MSTSHFTSLTVAEGVEERELIKEQCDIHQSLGLNCQKEVHAATPWMVISTPPNEPDVALQPAESYVTWDMRIFADKPIVDIQYIYVYRWVHIAWMTQKENK